MRSTSEAIGAPRFPRTTDRVTRIRRAADRVRTSVPFRVITTYGESQASNYAAALAFAAFLSMFPMILGALSIIGFAIRDPATEARFQNLILQLFPGSAQLVLQRAILCVRQSAGCLRLVSLPGIVWSASGIFATMESALTLIFGRTQRSLLRQKVMGFVAIMLVVVALGITVAANAAAGYLSNYVPYAWVLSVVIGASVMVMLLALLYRFVPNRNFSLHQGLPPPLPPGGLIQPAPLLVPPLPP